MRSARQIPVMNWREINERYVRPALSAWKSGDPAAAETIFKEGLEATGNDGFVALKYAEFLEDAGRLEEAQRMFKIGLEKLPKPEFKQAAREGLQRICESMKSHRKEPCSEPKSKPTVPDFRKKYQAEYRTRDGRFVRSKSEGRIADWLYDHKVRYEYERKVADGIVCDFYLPDIDTYIEFWLSLIHI